MMTKQSKWVLGLGGMVLAGLAVAASDVPEGGYEVHDSRRPQPTVVEPGKSSTQEQAGTAPSDATVLFDGKDLSAWTSKGGDAQWTVEDGYFAVKPKAGSLVSKESFGDAQIHLEWSQPEDIEGTGQGRGNSGVLIMGMYEVQILDSYQNETYADGGAGSVYGQYPPLVNPTRKPGEWNVYDIIFHKPVVEAGKVTQPARLTVLLNGVLVQDNVELLGQVQHKKLASYGGNLPEKAPLSLQDHGNPVRFRNIWVRELAGNPVPASKEAAEHFKH